MFEELLILIAVEIEGRGDQGVRTDDLAHPPRQLGLRARHAAHRHRPVQAEIDAVERLFGFHLGDHLADQGFEGLLGDPARSHVGFRP
jgi:hypothetical protein